MVETIPSYEEMMPAALKALSDGQQKTLKQIYDDVVAHYGFTDEQLALTISSGKTTYVRSRAGWAKTYLVKAGLIHQPKRGICVITNRGREALTSHSIVNNEYLSQFEAFNRFLSTSADQKQTNGSHSEVVSCPSRAKIAHQHEAQTPTEMMAQAFTSINSALVCCCTLQ